MQKQRLKSFQIQMFLFFIPGLILFSCNPGNKNQDVARERISINEGWKFYKYESADAADQLIYDVRPEVVEARDDKDADTPATAAINMKQAQNVLKAWILPCANDFINDSSGHYLRPEGNPGADFPFVQNSFDDSAWEQITLPHDWAIKGPFFDGPNPEVGGGMGRLPSNGVAWYRKKLDIPEADKGKSVFLDIDGAMSYAMVWFNGNLLGGWPYGYNSFRLDLTPHLKYGSENQLAIRIDNPNHSARWYPGAGLYRNVWLVKTNPVHVHHWGTFIVANNISASSAELQIEVSIKNSSTKSIELKAETKVFSLDEDGNKSLEEMAVFPEQEVRINSGEKSTSLAVTTINHPRLWGPPPTQQPNLYVAETTIKSNGKAIDKYETTFGIRSLEFHPEKGLMVNNEKITFKGVNQHHDLGCLGAAFNTRAAERQLEILQEMGCNAIRMAHNPPAPELLDLCDKMGFLVIDEIFDSWERKKTPHDFHLIFPEWCEADTRSFIRRDRNHPSIVAWSFGNEVGEQYTDAAGTEIAKRLYDIVKEEDATRPATASMNYAKPHMPFSAQMDIISLNYQGEGIRNAPAYKGLQGINTPPLYPAFREKYPDKLIVSSENAAALSTRGTYLFPVNKEMSAPVKDGFGGDPVNQFVSAYELYTAPFGSSADKVFASLDQHPYVAGGFVWSGWDYLGEPTPYYGARSSYYGVIDLAGFKKDRFYLYQSYWNPDVPMVHILPHWNWPERIGQTTPVHVFTSGDEAELFLNEKSLGKKKMADFEYRIRWDEVKYEPGELKVVAYKNGEHWAENSVKTTSKPAKLKATADRNTINADGKDLAFVTVEIMDENGLFVPNSNNHIEFSLVGPGKIIATDNGDPRDFTPFSSLKRNAFNGLALIVVQSKKGESGEIILSAESDGLESGNVIIKTE